MKTKVLFGIAGALLLIAAILSAVAWTPLPDLDREAILEKAAHYEVTVHRDTYGVPHIYGTRDPDVAFGLAYAHSEDDFENIALSIAMARGQYARFVGPPGAQTDYLVQLMRVQEVVEEKYDTDLAPETKALVEAYADGINLYGIEHGEGKWRGLLPVSGKDVIAGFVFRTPFFFGFQDELARIFDPKGFEETPDGEVTASLLNGKPLPMGSNAIALAPTKSAEGVTRLAVNSHQPYEGPVAWYEIVLHSGDGWHVAGSTFPGAPLMLHGHNENLGWAQTVNKPDLADVYALTVNPDDPGQYLYDGAWTDFEEGKARLRVRLFGPFSWVFKRELLWTVYGPAIRLDHGTFAFRHAGLDEVRHVEETYRLNKAVDFAEWRAALDMQATLSTNYVYADRTGRIAYFYNAKMPRRTEGFDWLGLVPGDTSKTQWQGYHPLAEVPHYVAPASGYLLNSNNQPFQATAPEDNLSADEFPESFGIREELTNRARRGLKLFGELDMVSRDDFYRIKFDKAYDPESQMRTLLQPLIDADSQDDETRAGVEALRAWSGSAEAGDTQAALAILTGLRLFNEKPASLEEKLAILREVRSKLIETHGKADIPWGDVNRIRRGAVDLPLGGGPDTLRAIYGGDTLDEAGTLTAMAGDTFVMMVAWDEVGKVSSESIHQYGSATLDAQSPHYADQVALYAEEKFKPVWFAMEDLAPHIVRSYQPGRTGAQDE